MLVGEGTTVFVIVASGVKVGAGLVVPVYVGVRVATFVGPPVGPPPLPLVGELVLVRVLVLVALGDPVRVTSTVTTGEPGVPGGTGGLLG